MCCLLLKAVPNLILSLSLRSRHSYPDFIKWWNSFIKVKLVAGDRENSLKNVFSYFVVLHSGCPHKWWGQVGNGGTLKSIKYFGFHVITQLLENLLEDYSLSS